MSLIQNDVACVTNSKSKRRVEVNTGSKANRSIPTLKDLMKLVRQSPLLLSESKSQYAKMFRRLVNDLKCGSYMELLLVKDAIDETWTIIRLRKASIGAINRRANKQRKMEEFRRKRQLNEADKQELMAEVGNDIKDEPTRSAAFTEMSEWICTLTTRESDNEQEVYEANALEDGVDYQIKINLLIDAAMKRRNDALKQLEWCRKSLAGDLRTATDAAIHAATTETVARTDADDVSIVPEG